MTLKIEVSLEGQWQCDHCKTFYPSRQRKLQLFARADDPLFHRGLDLCLPCAKLVSDKMKESVLLWEAVKEDELVLFDTPYSDSDGGEHRRPLEAEGGESEGASSGDLPSLGMSPA